MLIGGTGRSGTTILCRTFARHPDVSDVPEWRFTTDPDGVVDYYTQSTRGLTSPFHVDVRLKRLETLLDRVATRGRVDSLLGASRVRRWGNRMSGRNLAPAYARTSAVDYSPHFEELASRLLSRLRSATYDGYWVGMRPLEPATISYSNASHDEVRRACRDFLEGVAADVCAHQGVGRHLEKNTWNILCWHRTLEVLPDAKLVHIVRDPRDVVASYSQQPWAPHDAVGSAHLVRALIDEWASIADQVPGSSYREIRLEDLVADPEGELRRLCEFWELEWSPELLGSGLSTDSIGRWRRDLSPHERDRVEDIVSPLMERYSYAG